MVFSGKRALKIRDMNILFLFKMTEIRGGGGYNLGSRKQLLDIKVSFCINKPGFQGLMLELVTCSLL